MTSPTEIIKGVFIGDQYTSADFEFFLKNHITRVVNCTPDVLNKFPWVKYYRIPLGDSPGKIDNEIMLNNLSNAIKFVLSEPLQDNDKVLIHCHAGVSRSCTVAVAVLRICCADSLQQAIAMVIAKRPIAFYNGTRMNFRQALHDYFNE